MEAPRMQVSDLRVPSAALRRDVLVRVQRPARSPSYGGEPWVWLLHGRGSGVNQLQPVLDAVASAVATGQLAPLVVAVPDGPWLGGRSWFVDGAGGPESLPVETALLTEVLPRVEAASGGPVGRARRTVAGISMGGAAATRWALVHRDVFASALLLAPAVYDPQPPPGSSAVTGGAFADATGQFCLECWRRTMHYPTLLAALPEDLARRLQVVIAVGDAEPPNGGATTQDLDLEAARLHVALKRRTDITSSLRIVEGGHDDSVWSGQTVLGLRRLGLGAPAGRESPVAVPGPPTGAGRAVG